MLGTMTQKGYLLNLDKHVVEISFGVLKEYTETGKKLISYAENFLKEKGYEQMIYYILSNNKRKSLSFSSIHDNGLQCH